MYQTSFFVYSKYHYICIWYFFKSVLNIIELCYIETNRFKNERKDDYIASYYAAKMLKSSNNVIIGMFSVIEIRRLISIMQTVFESLPSERVSIHDNVSKIARRTALVV